MQLRALGKNRTCDKAFRKRMSGSTGTRAWRARRGLHPRGRVCNPTAALANRLRERMMGIAPTCNSLATSDLTSRSHPHIHIKVTERVMGVGPTIVALGTRCSTTELHPRGADRGSRTPVSWVETKCLTVRPCPHSLAARLAGLYGFPQPRGARQSLEGKQPELAAGIEPAQTPLPRECLTLRLSQRR